MTPAAGRALVKAARRGKWGRRGRRAWKEGG
jgi:hypothetical protein